MTLFTPFRFTPAVIRQQVEQGRMGSYILGFDQEGFVGQYVGRSDTCLQRRLSLHNHLWTYDYFVFKYATTLNEAFFQECELYHSYLLFDKQLHNLIHPAMPSGSGLVCPYCDFRDGVNQLFHR
jgi:hypothetical protein